MSRNLKRARDDYENYLSRFMVLLPDDALKLPEQSINRLLLFVDSPTAFSKAIKTTTALAKKTGADITIVFIKTGESMRVSKVEGIPSDSYLEDLAREIIEKEGIRFDITIVKAPSKDDLTQLLAKVEVDLVLSSCPLHEHPSGVECAVDSDYSPFSEFLLNNAKVPCFFISLGNADSFSRPAVVTLYEQGLAELISYARMIAEPESTIPVQVMADISGLVRLQKVSGIPEDPAMIESLVNKFVNDFNGIKSKYEKLASPLKLNFKSSTGNFFEETKKFLEDNDVSVFLIAISDYLGTHSDVLFLELINRNIVNINFLVYKYPYKPPVIKNDS